MESLNQTMQSILKKNASDSSDLSFKPEMCENCGTPRTKLIEFMGTKKIVSMNCKCMAEAYDKKQQDEKNKERQIRLQQMIKNSLMTSDARRCTFNNWDFKLGSPRMFDTARKYADDFENMRQLNVGLLIYGEPGNGKTYSCHCIANELLGRFIPVIVVHVDDILNRIKATYASYGQEGAAEVINALSNADLLIIDDLGTEQDTEWSRSMMYTIIDSRYRTGKPLIVTTNVTVKTLEERYHKRTSDRIFEMCTLVKNDGKSIRLEKGIEKAKVVRNLLSS